MRLSASSTALLLLSLLAGCGGGGAPGGSLLVMGPQATPTQLNFPGGVVTISAAVQASSAVSRAWAHVTKPDATTEDVDMALSGAAYSATWSAPANTSTQGQASVYSVVVHARDFVGNEAAGTAVTVTVVAAPAPPAPPGI